MAEDVNDTGEQEAPNGDDGQSKPPGWRSLFYFTSSSHSFTLAAALILSVAAGVIIPILAFLLGKVFDLFTKFGANELSGPDLVKRISTYALALVALGSGSGLLNAGFLMTWLIFGEMQAKSVRHKLFASMLEKEMEWYDLRRAGVDALITRFQTYVNFRPLC